MPDVIQQHLLSFIFGALGLVVTTALSVIAWGAQRLVAQGDTHGKKLAGLAEAFADSRARLETVLDGGDDTGQGGLRGDMAKLDRKVDQVMDTFRAQNDTAHQRLGEWSIWRERKDGADNARDDRLDEHHDRLDVLEVKAKIPRPTRRTVRRRREDR